MMNCNRNRTDFGPGPHAINMGQCAGKNENFRTAVWTGCHMQMTVMCIPSCDEVGLEMHSETDQYIRVEQGKAIVVMGTCKNNMNCKFCLSEGEAVFIPAGYWHNIMNMEECPLKLSSIYAPPHHPAGTVQHVRPESYE